MLRKIPPNFEGCSDVIAQHPDLGLAWQKKHNTFDLHASKPDIKLYFVKKRLNRPQGHRHSVLQFFIYVVTSSVLGANTVLSTLSLNNSSLCPTCNATNWVFLSHSKTNYNFSYFNLYSVCSRLQEGRRQLPHRMIANIATGYSAVDFVGLTAGTCTSRTRCYAFSIKCYIHFNADTIT